MHALTEKVCPQAQLDEYGAIKCVNYIRAAVKAGQDPRGDLAGALTTAQKPWDEDRFLFPVLPDDSLLCHDFGGPEDGMATTAEDARTQR